MHFIKIFKPDFYAKKDASTVILFFIYMEKLDENKIVILNN